MVPEIKKILYTTDLSPNARHAFGYAADLAKRYNAMVTILYVIERLNHIAESQVRDLLGKDQWEKVQSEKREELTEKINTRIETFCKEMDSKIDSCQLLIENILIKDGNPSEEILKTSKEIKADMIVMGSYGHNILQGALLGGTARKVVKNSQTPVLVVRLPKT
jgi:nucleotide-binding universal stress UspA family protein